jgi:hypothetical protein
METYRIYWLNRAGRIVGAPHLVDCATDGEAVSEARRLAAGRQAEIWNLKRFVGIVAAETPRAPRRIGQMDKRFLVPFFKKEQLSS